MKKPICWIRVIRAYAVPSRDWSTTYATEGHMIAGIREKAIPIIDIVTSSSRGNVKCSKVKCPELNHGSANVTLLAAEKYAIMRYTGISSTDPSIIKSARLPILSTINPNRGVAIIAEIGSKLLQKPACFMASDAALPPWAARILLVKKSIAKVRKGKIAE